ncbi:MAG: hypothetical protein JWM88_1039 [Verrucomicrobia bacterium]|nr:hypothetical protein [Verrucomicrobiota bacterium]
MEPATRMSPTFRRFLLAFHARAGLVAGLLLMIVALSGATISALAWMRRDAVRESAGAGIHDVRMPFDQLIAQARVAHPASALTFIRFFKSPGSLVIVRFADGVQVFLNPATGAPVEREILYGRLNRFLVSLHTFEYAPGGGFLAGAVALAALLLVVTGVRLWWSAGSIRQQRSAALGSRFRGPRRLIEIHKAVGLCAAVFIGVSALTGVPQAFSPVLAGLYPLAGFAAPKAPRNPMPSDGPGLPMEEIARIAAARMPDVRETVIHFPRKGVVSIQATDTAAPHSQAHNYLYLDSATGAELGFVPYARVDLGHRIYLWMLAMHLGELGGAPGRLAMLFGALAVPVLAVTGATSFLRRRNQRLPQS